MAEASIMIPVFLPGNSRDWDEVAGVATINEEGDIVVKLQRPEHGMKLVEEQQAGRLICLAFDYTPKPEEN